MVSEINQSDVLPNNWKWTTVEEITWNHDGKRIPVRKEDRAQMQGEYPYYGASGVIDHVNDYLFDGVYLLLAEDGANLLSRSTPIAFQAKGRFWVNNHAHVLTTLGQIPLSYLEHYLNGVALNQYITGTAQPKLTQRNMNVVPVPLAPLPEQRRIVEEIEAQFSRLDAGIAALKRVQANLKRYKASVLKAACEGQLVPQDPADEPASELLARILTERRAKWEAEQLAKYEAKGKKPPKNWREKYKEPQPPDTSGLPELPEGWVWASVEQLIVEPFSNGRSVRSANHGFPVLRLTAIADGRINLDEFKIGEWSEEAAQPFLVKSQDFLVSRGSGSVRLVGRGGLVVNNPQPMAFPDTMIRVRVNYKYVRPGFLQIVWESPILRIQIEGAAHTTAGIHKINQQHLSRFAIPIPPLKDQERIVRDVERRLSVVEGLQLSLDIACRRAERLRQSILKEAFAGRLVPQDPDDEPASVLLERIQAARKSHKA